MPFKRFCGGGNGVIYAVGYDGNPYWLRHNSYLSPLPVPTEIVGANPLGRFSRTRPPWLLSPSTTR